MVGEYTPGASPVNAAPRVNVPGVPTTAFPVPGDALRYAACGVALHVIGTAPPFPTVTATFAIEPCTPAM